MVHIKWRFSILGETGGTFRDNYHTKNNGELWSTFAVTEASFACGKAVKLLGDNFKVCEIKGKCMKFYFFIGTQYIIRSIWSFTFS